MSERVESMPGVEVTWEPNAPEAVLISDDFGRGALALRAHPEDPNQQAVVLRFDLVIFSLMTPLNDAALHHHALYEHGLQDLQWLGVVRESSLVSRLKPSWSPVAELHLRPLHFVAPLKECVVEVVAAEVDVFRLNGLTREAAFAAVDPDHPLTA